MDKVYIVTEGEYSDYAICGVFTTREAADQAIKLGEFRYAEVEVWTLNETADSPVQYHAGVLLDGTVKFVHDIGPRYDLDGVYYEPRAVKTTEGLYFYGYGKTAEHARRAADQLRREYKVTAG